MLPSPYLVRERPSCSAAEKRDELPPPQLIECHPATPTSSDCIEAYPIRGDQSGDIGEILQPFSRHRPAAAVTRKGDVGSRIRCELAIVILLGVPVMARMRLHSLVLRL